MNFQTLEKDELDHLIDFYAELLRKEVTEFMNKTAYREKIEAAIIAFMDAEFIDQDRFKVNLSLTAELYQSQMVSIISNYRRDKKN